jgi:hypothetical protein
MVALKFQLALSAICFLIACVSQGEAFRARRSDNKAVKEEAAQLFVPAVHPTKVAASQMKRNGATESRLGTFGVGSNAMGYQQAFRSLRLSAGKDSLGDNSTAGDHYMRELALAALDSGGDPSQLAVFMVDSRDSRMNEARRVEEMKMETLKKAARIQYERGRQDVLDQAKDMPGVTQPFLFFDPVGFCTNTTEGKLCFFREVELKHGRVAMLASVGFLVAEQFHPLFGGNIDVPSYIAFQQTPLQTFWPAVVAAIAIPEIFSVFTFRKPEMVNVPLEDGTTQELPKGWWQMKTDRVSGDLGFDPLGLKPTDPKEFKEMQTKEINNGRLAMIAAAGMVAQELATGQKLF